MELLASAPSRTRILFRRAPPGGPPTGKIWTRVGGEGLGEDSEERHPNPAPGRNGKEPRVGKGLCRIGGLSREYRTVLYTRLLLYGDSGRFGM
jgi:hypothetical protein